MTSAMDTSTASAPQPQPSNTMNRVRRTTPTGLGAGRRTATRLRARRSPHNTATLFIFNNPFEIEPTDWLVHTIEGDWLIFDDDNMQDLFEYVEEHEAT